MTPAPREDRELLSLEAIVQWAHAATSAEDPTPDAFSTNLRVLVDSVNDEGRLNAPGIAAVTRMLGDALRRRIDVTSWWFREPTIQRGAVPAPIFLTGLPRSGTTYFQYLFDREPSMRMLRTWEGDDPCPPPAVDPLSAVQRRARRAETDRRRRQRDGGAMDAFHLSDPDGPQECVMMMDQTFANAGNYWTLRVPTYFRQVAEHFDLRVSYEHHKRMLQVLQWQAPPQRWALKWPCHLLALDAILDVYPDALFVVTHRDPLRALASNCSFSSYLRRQFSDDVDLHEIGRQMKDMVGRHIHALVDFDIRRGSGVPIAHVDYDRVVADPVTVMEQVYETLGLEMTASVRASVAAWREANPPGRRGVHAYELGDYGLEASEVADEYADYIDRYAVTSSTRPA